LNCLLASFPESGLELYNTLDYWTCRELLDVGGDARINPEHKKQEEYNSKFANYLNKRHLKKFLWQEIPLKKNLRQIKKSSYDAFGM
jgi:hypothetical protein